MVSQNENKVDLSDINKVKKQIKFPKISNPFKKRSTWPGRDAEGKFVSGSGGLLQAKKLNLKRTLPLIAVVALVGGFFVFQSFAGTTKPNYQYSVFSCGAVDKSKNPNYACQDNSAESMVYRTYKAVLGREPLKTDYKSWVQPMVGGSQSLPGRMQPELLIKRVMGTSEAKSKDGLLFNSNSNRSGLVSKLYQKTLGRTPSTADIAWWNKEISAKKWSDERLVEVFLNTSEAKQKLRPGFLTALSSQKFEKFSIDNIVKRKQEKRTQDAKTINSKSVAIIEEMQKRSVDNNNRKISAGNLANQPASRITKDTIATIQDNNYNVIKARLDGFQGQEYKGKITANLTSVRALYIEARTVSSQSPDITSAGITDAYKKAQSYVSEADRQIANANWLLGETGRAKGIAEQKYNEHQAYLKAKADCESKGGTYTNGCKMPQQAPSGGGTGGGGSVDGGGSAPAGPGLTYRCPSTQYTREGDSCWNYNDKRTYDCPGGYVLRGGRCVREQSTGKVDVRQPTCPSGYKAKVSGAFPCVRWARASVSSGSAR